MLVTGGPEVSVSTIKAGADFTNNAEGVREAPISSDANDTATANEPIRIAFVDDHPILLSGLVSLFSEMADYMVVATGNCADDALKIEDTHKPNVLFLDLSMPGDVFAAISKIAECSKKTKIIVFTAFSSVDSAMRALDAGANGFLLKGATFAELKEAVDAVTRDELYITRHYAKEIMSGMRNRLQREAVNRAMRLNVREEQILAFVRQARTNKEIATSLSISEKTVKRYMSGLMSKLHARNRVDVAMYASRQATPD